LLSENSKGAMQNARATHKHSIRKEFHKQLKELWEINPFLANAKLAENPDIHPKDRPKARIFGYPNTKTRLKDFPVDLVALGIILSHC
jgi:hypothetical protein